MAELPTLGRNETAGLQSPLATWNESTMKLMLDVAEVSVFAHAAARRGLFQHDLFAPMSTLNPKDDVTNVSLKSMSGAALLIKSRAPRAVPPSSGSSFAYENLDHKEEISTPNVDATHQGRCEELRHLYVL